MTCPKCNKEQIKDDEFCTSCGFKFQKSTETTEVLSALNKSNFKNNYKSPKGRLIFGIIIGLIILFSIISSFSEEQPTESVAGTNNQAKTGSTQEQIVSSVVNIFCPSTKDGIDPSGGSGTILTEDGLILTNSHIVPQDEKYIFVDDNGCLVILPDATTGQPSEYFLARPIVIPGISDIYDLAYMQIHSAMYDEEKREYMGTYPRTFPAFDDTTRCKDENVQLGESVRIYGYPAISGGYSLTVTDGIVSSFPGDDLIITSAKISHGNSGGLAVDRYGCMIGIPSMVSSDEYESLGVIISVGLINSFSDEVDKYLEQL